MRHDEDLIALLKNCQRRKERPLKVFSHHRDIAVEFDLKLVWLAMLDKVVFVVVMLVLMLFFLVLVLVIMMLRVAQNVHLDRHQLGALL